MATAALVLSIHMLMSMKRMENLFDFPVGFPVVEGRRMKGGEEGNGADFLGEREDAENEAEEHCVCTFEEHLDWTWSAIIFS